MDLVLKDPENIAHCVLAGEDQGFVKNYVKKGTSIFKPVDASEIFPKDHFKEFRFDN